MWILITKLQPPCPPQPQIPRHRHVPPGIGRGPNLDQLVDDHNVPVSYCPLLMDPEPINDYKWVDEELRKTIRDCMYHRPRDRPTLERLLEEAKDGAQRQFPGEDDDYIRQWIKRWF